MIAEIIRNATERSSFKNAISKDERLLQYWYQWLGVSKASLYSRKIMLNNLFSAEQNKQKNEPSLPPPPESGY